jgi:outer membrane lipoprotein-sorting protein
MGPGAAAPAAPAAEPPTEAEKMLDAAIKRVAAIESVSSDILEKVKMLGQKFEIQGRYLKAPKDKIYLSLKVVGLPDAEGSMLQVSDGSTLWDYQQVYETKIYHKFDAKAILAKLRTADLDDELRQQIMTQMGLAGPETLLVGLRKIIHFNQKEKGTLDGRPVWILRGEWKSREGLYGPNSQPLPLLAQLPEYVPSLVSVYLGEDDSWPYKVLMIGRKRSLVLEDTRRLGPDGQPIGARSKAQKPLLTTIELNYNNVKLNAPVPDDEFVFQAPPGVPAEDDTQRILAGLEQAATVRAAQKKEAASKAAEEPVLNQAIDVPKAAPGAPPSGVAPK